MMVIVVVIVAQSTTAFALEYTTYTLDNGQQLKAYVNLNVPSDITQKTNLAPEMIEALLPANLKGLGQTFYNGEQQHNINALFVLAVVRLESGNGTSFLARTQNNLGGIKSGENGYRTFASKDESIAYMFDLLHRKYIGEGRVTIPAIGSIYCPTGGWAPQVTEIMQQLIAKSNGTDS